MNDLMQIDERNGAVPQLPGSGGIDAVTRAEIDIQISTAHAYPRSMTRVAQNVKNLVTMSKQTAESCIFSLPRGGKPIVGPSIRLAEILFSQWGNCTGGSRTVDVNRKEGYVEAEGVFHDLETNAKTVRRTRRSIKGRNGQVYSDDMIIVTANAAGAIAFRNAVLAGVPRPVWGEAYANCEALIRGDIKSLPEKRDGAFKAMAAFGLSQEDVCKILGVVGAKDIGVDHLVTLSGLHNALKGGEVEAEELINEAEARDARSSGAMANGKGKDDVVDVDPGPKPATKPKTTKRKPVDRTPPKPAEPEPEPEPDVVDASEADAADDSFEPDTSKEQTEPEPEGAEDQQGNMSSESKQDDEAEARARNLLNAIQKDVDDSGSVEAVRTFYSNSGALKQIQDTAPGVWEETKQLLNIEDENP